MSNNDETAQIELTDGQKCDTALRQMFADMAKYAPSKLFGILGNALIVPVYTSMLLPGQYGLYSISLAVLSFLCILFSDWVGLSGLRFFRKHQLQQEIPKYLSTLVMLLTVNISVMFLIAFVFRHHFYDFFKIPPKMFLFILVLIIPVAIRALLFQILRAQIKPSAFTISTIANQILTIGISVAVIKYFHLGALSILIGMFLSIGIIDVVLMFQSNIFDYFKFEMPKFDTLKCLYIYGIPIAIASISMWSITQSNKFILRHFRGFDEVGYVGVAYGLTFPILMTLFAIITIAAFPRIINLYEDGVDVRPVISKLTGYFFLLALPLVFIGSLYSNELVAIFANTRFAKAAILLPYLSFAAMFLSLADYTTMQYHLANKMYINTILKVFSGALGLVLYYFLIKDYGIIGVGIAALITNFVYFFLSAVVTLPNLNWQFPFKTFFKILIAFIPSVFMYYIFRNFLIFDASCQIVILIAFYYLTYYVFSFFKIKENA